MDSTKNPPERGPMLGQSSMGQSNIKPGPSMPGQDGDLERHGREALRRGTEMYEEAKRHTAQAYDRASHAVQGSYRSAMDYGRENPGKLTLIALGAGIGIGMLLANRMMAAYRRPLRRRMAHRYRNFEPVVHALTDVARQYLR